MNYKCTFSPLFLFKSITKHPYYAGGEKRLFPWRWTMAHFARGKIAIIEMVMPFLYLITFSLRCILWVAI